MSQGKPRKEYLEREKEEDIKLHRQRTLKKYLKKEKDDNNTHSSNN